MSYICIELKTPVNNASSLECLSPLVMQWSDNIWIFDLRASLSFWKQQYTHSDDMLKAWQQMLYQTFGPQASQADYPELSGSETFIPFRAVYGDNVFQCLALLKMIQSTKPVGLVSFSSPFAQHFYRSLSWDVWWDVVGEVAGYWQSLRLKGFKQAVFNKQCSRLRLALPKLGFSSPLEATRMPVSGIRRRYGAWLSLILSWTSIAENKLQEEKLPLFSKISDSSLYYDGLLTNFPWVTWMPTPKRRVVRYLPFPLTNWEPLVPMLIQDLDACISKRAHIDDERVLLFSWTLHLENQTKHQVFVRFKHPLALYSQKGCHSTALIHFRSVFESLGCSRDNSPTLRIVDWELCVEEKMCIPVVQAGLWDNRSTKASTDVLAYIENNVSSPLATYAMASDWCHDSSFVSCSNHHLEHELSSSLTAVAKKRPLFLYKNPVAHKKPIRMVFLEQTMTKWWESDSSLMTERLTDRVGAQNLNERLDVQFFRWKRHGRWEWGQLSPSTSEAITYGVFS